MNRGLAGAVLCACVATGLAFGADSGPVALPMPSGKATVVSGLGKGDVATNCIPVREGNVVRALNKRLEINPRSGGLKLVVDNDTVFTCGESYCFVDGKTGAKSWGVFATGPRARKWHSRIEAREEDGAYVTEAFLKTAAGEECLQNRTTLRVLPDGLVQATFEGFPSRDASIVRIDNPDGLYFGGGKKTLPGSSADFGGKVARFDDEPSVKVDYNGRWKGAKDFPIVYYRGDPVREFVLTLTKGMSGSVGWGVWTKDVMHGSFGGGGKKTVFIDIRRGVKRALNPNVRGGIDWQAVEDLEMPERRKNIVENASFERGWRCWDSFRLGMGGVTPEKWDTEFFAIDGEVAHSGRRSLRCRALERAAGMSIYGLESMSTSLCPVPEPGRYTASFWARATHTNVVASVWCPSFLYCTSWKTSSRWMPKTKECSAKLSLTTEWKRYSFSFDLPESDPFKLLFSFAVPKGSGEGVAWVDDVQVEKGGEATPFAPPAAEAELVMSDPDQFCDPDLPLDARLTVYAARAGEVDVEVKSFLGEPIFARTYAFEPQDGRAVVALDGLEAALPGSGVYRMKRTFRLASGETAFEHDRFTLAKPLDGVPRKWRFLQSDYGDPFREAGVRRTFARWRRIGIDRLYGPPSGLNPAVRELARSYGLDCGAYRIANGGLHEVIVKDPKKKWMNEKRRLKGPSVYAADYDLARPTADYAVTNTPMVNTFILGHRQLGVPMDETYLKRLEDAAAAKVSRYPSVGLWECSSEINCALGYAYWSDDNDWDHQMRNFSKWLAAIYRGAKRANPKAIVSNDSAMNMSPSCLEEIKATLRYCAEEGVRFDAIGAHTYRYSPESPDLDDGFRSLSEAAVALGYPDDVPFVCGEGMHWGPYEVRAWGLQSSNWQGNPERWWDGPSALSYDIGRTEIRSAAWRARSWLVAYKYARRMLEMNSGNTNNFELDANQTPFLSQIISSVLANLLGSADFVADVRFAPYCRAYVFTDEKGRGIAAVWNHKPEVDESREDAPRVSADFGDALETVLDMVGSRRAFPGRGDFAVTPQPLYFVSKPGRTDDLVSAVRKFRVVSGDIRDRAEVSFNPVSPDETAVCVKEFTGAVTNFSEKVATPFAYDAVRVARCETAKADYPAFLVGRVPESATAATIDWSKVPAMKLANRCAKPGPAFAATQQLVWNAAGLYLRVAVTDPTFVHVAEAKPSQRYDNDCLQVFLDGLSNARFNHRKGFDDDDYAYDVLPEPDGRSARVYRRRSPDIQLTLGIYAPKNGVFAEELPATFEKTGDGYVYTVTFPAKYVLPLRLEKGRCVGFGISVSDANDPKAPVGKRYLGGLVNTVLSGKGPYDHPERWPVALLWE